MPMQYAADKERYVIHIHGLHHTGTGYLRQTLHDALNKEFPSESASTMDGLRQQFRVPENEGQHLQSVYPPLIERVKAIKAASGMGVKNAAKALSVADLCILADDGDVPAGIDDIEAYGDEQIGRMLLQQWSRYWDMSATFLIQKTPSLDVQFLERTKVLPTLHILVVRHPLASNSIGNPNAGRVWLEAYLHVLDLLARRDIQWYAVVTYEALVQYHDAVVEELLEVVRSGVARLKDGRRLNGVSNRRNGDTTGQFARQRRRLPYHTGHASEKRSPVSYLVPEERSVRLWEECLLRRQCHEMIEQLTKDVLPHFGYVSVRQSNETGSGWYVSKSLSPFPGPVTVGKKFGRVLFTSEDAALNRLRQSGENGTVDYEPSPELISAMEALIQ
ncbi:hypothetical protein ACHAXT_009358 [Thalassiosira profunda]